MTLKSQLTFCFNPVVETSIHTFTFIQTSCKLLYLIVFIIEPGVYVQWFWDYFGGRLASGNVSMCCVLQGEMLSPCRCSGSVRCTHEPCLIKWISERGSWSCELCYYKYQVIAISTKNPLQVTLPGLVLKVKAQI